LRNGFRGDDHGGLLACGGELAKAAAETNLLNETRD
jgi:hypothetical protein